MWNHLQFVLYHTTMTQHFKISVYENFYEAQNEDSYYQIDPNEVMDLKVVFRTGIGTVGNPNIAAVSVFGI